MGLLDKAMADWDEMSNPFFPISPDLMFQVCIAAGAKLGWPIFQIDSSSKTITFRATQQTFLNGKAEDMLTIYISPAVKDGKPGVRLNYPISEFEGAVYGALKQMGLLKNGEYIDPDARPPRKSPAPTVGKNPFSGSNQDETASSSAPPSAESVADELKAVTDLHKSGALSDEEFAAAKRKILGADT